MHSTNFVLLVLVSGLEITGFLTGFRRRRYSVVLCKGLYISDNSGTLSGLPLSPITMVFVVCGQRRRNDFEHAFSGFPSVMGFLDVNAKR